MKKVFVSDLDGTLIFTDRDNKISNYKDFTCIEKLDKTPLSFISKRALKELNILNKAGVVIPCTMRTYEQMKRISFFTQLPPKHSICLNGAEIRFRGKIDKKWYNLQREQVTEREILTLVSKLSNRLNKLNVIIRNKENFIIEIKVFKVADIEEVKSKLIDLIDYNIYELSRKVFIIPKSINKINALKYLMSEYGIEHTFASGDEYIDKDFVEYASMSVVPGHSKFNPCNGIKLKDLGINAGDKITDIAFKWLKTENPNKYVSHKIMGIN